MCSDSDSAVIGKWRRRMGSAIDELLPRAVAIDISVTTIITTVFMLLSPKAKSRPLVCWSPAWSGSQGLLPVSHCWPTLPTRPSGGS